MTKETDKLIEGVVEEAFNLGHIGVPDGTKWLRTRLRSLVDEVRAETWKEAERCVPEVKMFDTARQDTSPAGCAWNACRDIALAAMIARQEKQI